MNDTPPKTPTEPTAPGLHDLPASARRRRMPEGVYVPMLAFFDPETEEVDIPATQRHAARLVHAGVSGLVLHGSNGEAVHLSRAERSAIIQAVADTVRHEHFDISTPFPVVAGCGAQSVRETVELCREAAEAGATHALVLPPGYYAGMLGREHIRAFFVDVARRSPLPVLVYNFPGAANGVDLDSDAVCALAREDNIVGVKLTCGNTGKLARVAARTAKLRADFFVAGGSADFILQGAVAGAHGTIAGLANLGPRSCVRILKLFRQGRLDEARDLQATVADADWVAIKYGFVGVKGGMPLFWGKGEPGLVPRRPCKAMTAQAMQEFEEGSAGLVEVERALR